MGTFQEALCFPMAFFHVSSDCRCSQSILTMTLDCFCFCFLLFNMFNSINPLTSLRKTVLHALQSIWHLSKAAWYMFILVLSQRVEIERCIPKIIQKLCDFLKVLGLLLLLVSGVVTIAGKSQCYCRVVVWLAKVSALL